MVRGSLKVKTGNEIRLTCMSNLQYGKQIITGINDDKFQQFMKRQKCMVTVEQKLLL